MKGFLDERRASARAPINLAPASEHTHTYVNTFLRFFCQHFLASPRGRTVSRVRDQRPTGVSSRFGEALEAGEEITSGNISVGQWSDGLLPIKMMDEPTLAAFSHTHTHTFLFSYTLTRTYRTVGDENKPVMGHSPLRPRPRPTPGGFSPEKHNPFG